MKLSLAFVLSVFLVACLDEGISGKGDSTYHSFVNELYSTKSPDGKKILTLKEIGDSSSCHTQVFIDFGMSGVGVYTTDGKDLGIKTYWKDNNTIVIETKKEYKAPFQKRPQVGSLNQVVMVEYIEK